MTSYLNTADLLRLADELGTTPRDVGLLAAAAHRPTATLQGKDIYPDLDHKAAALLDSLLAARLLHGSGAKLGWLAVVVFYAINEVKLAAPDKAAFELIQAVAAGDRTVEQAATQLAKWH